MHQLRRTAERLVSGVIHTRYQVGPTHLTAGSPGNLPYVRGLSYCDIESLRKRYLRFTLSLSVASKSSANVARSSTTP